MNNILIPRNIDSRIEQQKRIELQKIEEYIKNGSVGDLDLHNTHLNKLPDNLIRVEGSLHIQNSSIEDLNNLEYIKGNLWADRSELKSLPKRLTKIGGILSLTGCPINNINDINYIGGSIYIEDTNIGELPENLIIGGYVFYYSCLSKQFSDEQSFIEYLEKRNITIGYLFRNPNY